MRRLALAALVAACAPPAAAAPPPIRVCPACAVHTLAEALARIHPGGTIVLEAGTYREAGVLDADNVTLRAEPGAVLRDAAAEGKAALVVKGNDTVVTGLECAGIRVEDGNGACIRLEGRNLTLRHVHFHDSEEGLLAADGGGAVVVEDSRFERLGAGGRAHGVYVNAVDSLTIRRSTFLSGQEEGHEIKSRAARTTIEDSLVASLDGVDSRLVDVPDGGDLTLRGCVLEKGRNSASGELIGYGLEGMRHGPGRVRLDHTTVVVDRPRGGRLYHGPVVPEMSGLVMVGGSRADGTRWFPDRAAAGLPPYPALPGYPVNGSASLPAPK